MAHLRAGAAHALQQLAVGHDAAAYAGAQRDEYHVPAAHGPAGHRLRQRGAVGVVAEPAGKPQPRRHHPAYRHIEPAQVIGPHHHAVGAVAGPRRADADGRAVRRRDAGLLHGLLRRMADIRDNGFRRTFRPGGQADLRHDVLALVHHAGGDVGAAQINANTIHMLPPCASCSLISGK